MVFHFSVSGKGLRHVEWAVVWQWAAARQVKRSAANGWRHEICALIQQIGEKFDIGDFWHGFEVSRQTVETTQHEASGWKW